MLPPGFPALLALMIVTVGHSYAVLMRSMALFTTIGLITAYEILKSEEGRVVAGVVCLLLASSRSLFEFSTSKLFSDMPYFFASMFLLWAVIRLDSAAIRAEKRVFCWQLCVLASLLGSILLRSTGIALAGGILGWLGVSFFRERQFGKIRSASFFPMVLAGLAAQAAWMLWSEQHPVTQWPVHGYQESYLAQLKLKSGNYPELGMATWRDVLKRPIENEDDMATSMVGLFLHKQVSPAWYSPASVIPLALILTGLVYSFWRTGGGVIEWYFVGYQCLFLFWPWNFELRFQLPVAPLAAFYAWRGLRLLWGWTRSEPHDAGTTFLLVAGLGILSSAVWGWDIRHPSGLACIAMWLLGGCVSAVILVRGRDLLPKLAVLLVKPVSLRGAPVPRAAMAGGVVLTFIFAAGVWMQMVAGLENLRRVPEMNASVEAAEWIRGHSSPDTVVMARWEAPVYHFSGRRVIWFPASTDPQLLMAGIFRHHIGLIVVTDDDDSDSYWKPSDGHCFGVLMRAYPTRFRQVHQGPHEQVYQSDEEI